MRGNRGIRAETNAMYVPGSPAASEGLKGFLD
jgi:hypothetical protein